MEIVRKLATDCFKYGIENQGGGYPLQSLLFNLVTHETLENERETLFGILGDPARLRLDPVKMREMRLLMFPHEEEPEELGNKASCQ